MRLQNSHMIYDLCKFTMSNTMVNIADCLPPNQVVFANTNMFKTRLNESGTTRYYI